MKALSLKSLSLKDLSLKGISLSLPFNLQRREKIAVIAGAVALGLFLVFQLIIFPVFNKQERLHKNIAAKTESLKKIQELKAEYLALTRSGKTNQESLSQRPNSFTLFSFLDSLAGKTGIKENIDYMKPSTTNLKNSPLTLSIVEMKVKGLTMEQMVNFLHGVETSNNMVWMKRISITRDDKNQGWLNAILQVETFEK